MATENKKQNNAALKTTAKNNAKKLALAKTNIKLQNPGLVAFYNIQPGKRANLFL